MNGVGGLNLSGEDWISEAYVYGGGDPGRTLEDIPDDAWRTVRLEYPNGNILVFVFEQEESNSEKNFRETMWRLQAGIPSGVVFTVTLEDGTVTEGRPFADE